MAGSNEELRARLLKAADEALDCGLETEGSSLLREAAAALAPASGGEDGKLAEWAQRINDAAKTIPTDGLATLASDGRPLHEAKATIIGASALILERLATPTPQAAGVSDADVIARCAAAGIKWLPPSDDEDDGFPGMFDMTRMAEMRALFAALTAAGAAPEGVDWRALYRFERAMRFMDNRASLTKHDAFRMADEDVAGLERAAAPQPGAQEQSA